MGASRLEYVSHWHAASEVTTFIVVGDGNAICHAEPVEYAVVLLGVPRHPLIWQRHLEELMNQVVSHDPPLSGENHR
jgi:hypothetical protein